MATLAFETLSFSEEPTGVKVHLLNLFSTIIPREELEKIGTYSVERQALSFSGVPEEKARKSFLSLFARHSQQLTNNLTKNKATYIHRNSGIPLIGNVAFGIAYRNSSIIEIKPVTSCNLDCVYCSISEGLSSTKHDFIVEKDYLMEELDKLIGFAGEPVEVHIGVQGEPFLYGDIEPLFADLQERKMVQTISIDTNGTLLSRPRIDRLAQYTKLQLNLSLDAIDPETAKKMAGTKTYHVDHIKDVISYAAQKLNVIVAPVLTKSYNEQEMEKIIQFIKSLPVQPKLGIQNFLRYKTGRTPAEEIPWETFYPLLEEWEKKYDIKLRWSKEDFLIKKTKELPKPFQVGDVITATIKCPDRFPNSVIAVAKDRNISVPGCTFKMDKKIKVKITRDKHNIFVGKVV